MNRNEIITKLFTGKNFNDCLQKMEPEQLREDLRQEVILVICEMPEEKILGLHARKELEFFTVKVILNQIKSKTSPFARKYRNYNQELTTNEIADNIDTEERQLRELIEDMAIKEIDRLYWYNKGLIELYMVHGNFRAVQKQTGIPCASIYKTCKKTFKEIKQKVS